MTAQLLSGDHTAAIVDAANIIRAGGLVVVPTDTVYGLAAAALDPVAAARVFAAKERPADLRLPLLLSSAADLPLVAARIPRVAWRLIDRFWPGPLTLVFPAARSLSPALLAGGTSIGTRVPSGRTILQLLEVLGEPITGTSANLTGRPSATTAAHAMKQLGNRVDAVLAKDDEVQGGPPSTVVDLSGHLPVIRRQGAIGIDGIRSVIGMRMEVVTALTDAGGKP